MSLSVLPRPTRGQWLWTCRTGFERDLLEELSAKHGSQAHGAALVLSDRKPAIPPTFARQGFEVFDALEHTELRKLEQVTARALALALRARPRPEAPWSLHTWVPDADAYNPHAKSAEVLGRSVQALLGALDVKLADQRRDSVPKDRLEHHSFAQLCVLGPRSLVVGVVQAADAPCLHPGGRARMKVPDDAPSRAAMKLEEALDWLQLEPLAGETCVDLGAAPGGWTHRLLARGTTVLAIDPGEMAPSLRKHKHLRHIRGSAFDYTPETPVDWLFCDMVWRPLEVASLLARWGRKRWAQHVLANIKLPMKARAEFLERIKLVLADGQWKNLRFRQLYHDREEITFHAEGV